MSDSRFTKRVRWALAVLALTLAAVVLLGHSDRREPQTLARVQPAEVSPSSGSEMRLAPARAESDVLDLQLD